MLVAARESDDIGAITQVDNWPLLHASSRNNSLETLLRRLQDSRPDPRISYLGARSVALSGDALAADPVILRRLVPNFSGPIRPTISGSTSRASTRSWKSAQAACRCTTTTARQARWRSSSMPTSVAQESGDAAVYLLWPY